MTAGLGAERDRDLIEAGLSEPADAATRYGICAAALVPVERLGMMRCHHAGGGGVEWLVSVKAIDAPIGILGWAAGWGVCSAGRSARWRTQGVIASVNADAVTPSGSMLGRYPMVMTCRATVATARCASAAA